MSNRGNNWVMGSVSPFQKDMVRKFGANVVCLDSKQILHAEFRCMIGIRILYLTHTMVNILVRLPSITTVLVAVNTWLLIRSEIGHTVQS